MEDIGLPDDDQRDFCWETHYPGDEAGAAGAKHAAMERQAAAAAAAHHQLRPHLAELPAAQQPFLQHADLPGNLRYGTQLPIKSQQPSPEPPGLRDAHAPRALQHPQQQPVHRQPHPQQQQHAASLPPILRYESPIARAAGSSALHGAAAGAAAPSAPMARPRGGAAEGADKSKQATATPAAAADDDGSGTDTDEDGELIAKARQKALAERQRAATVIGKKRGPGTGKPRAGGGITLGLLIDEGILAPGENCLTVEYKSSMTYATLMPDGRISCHVNGNNMLFESPSAFSIYLKRLINPARKADDGWKTVKYNGRFLEQFKLELARRRFSGTRTPEDDSAGASGEGQAPKRPRTAEGGSPPNGRQAGVPHSPRAAPAGNGHAGDFAKSRPKRQAAARVRVHGLSGEEEHQMVPCAPYRGTPCSGSRDCQPFRVSAAPTAALLMDAHAHMSRAEVIGILGGTWDEAARQMRVARAVPVRALPIEDGSINVEMDPEDQLRATHTLDAQGLRCVGWYHSHPHFEAQPSIIDIKNQVLQQHQARDGAEEPYIGAIVGPYDDALPGNASHLTWFHVQHELGRLPGPEQDPLQAGCRPMALQVEMDEELDASPLMLQGEIASMAERYAASEMRVDMEKQWRAGQTRAQKLRASLATRLPRSWPPEVAAMFLNKAESTVMAAWHSAPPPPQKRPGSRHNDDDHDVEISELTEAEDSDATADDDAPASRGANGRL